MDVVLPERSVVSGSSAMRWSHCMVFCDFFQTRAELVTLPSLSVSGNGYCRSEAVVVILLTKRSMAKRIYATIVNAGSNTDGFKEQGRPSASEK